MNDAWLTRSCAVALLAVLSGWASRLVGQTAPHSESSSVTVVAGPSYDASGLHRKLFGTEYRPLWLTPIEVEVLDLRGYAGGLVPAKLGGGMETRTLHLESADGRKFAFRSVDKTHSLTLPPDLRGTTIERVAQDQTAAQHPAAALVVPPLLDAVGVPTAYPRLFVMPDDSVLGKFRSEFAGMLGTLEERPTSGTDQHPGFEGALEDAETDELYQRLDRDAREQIDSRLFLTARLIDLLVGDPDRAEGQWRWIKRDSSKTAPWVPVPYDRDEAFLRYEGMLISMVGHAYPWIVKFDEHYPGLLGLMWGSRNLDRRLLADLDWPAWDSVAHAVQHQLTDSVIDLAAHELPGPYIPLNEASLARALKARRDQLPEQARRFYRMLAREAEVHATHGGESVRATRRADGVLDLTIRANSRMPDELESFHRAYDARDTREIRLYLRGGSDTVRVSGNAEGPRLRIIAQDGRKVVIDDAAGGSTRLYDPNASATVAGLHAPSINRRAYQAPDSTSLREAAPRDWGGSSSLFPWGGSYSSDYGLTVGLGKALVDYGYRRDPYASRLEGRGGYATGPHAFSGEIRGDVTREISGVHYLFDARASGSDVLRYFGLGNATVSTAPDSFYQAHTSVYSISAAIGWIAYRHVMVQAGPVFRYYVTDLGRATLVGQTHPYGAEHFGELGVGAAMTYDSRDSASAPTRGVHATVEGTFFPPIGSPVSTFGRLRAETGTYLSAAIPLRPTLALRVGAERVWGTYPFEESAIIGGAETVRGLPLQRYRGDASAYGDAELRLRLVRFSLIVPTHLGVFGLADAGRVWLTGESSDDWHTAVGGGLWLALVNRKATLTFTAARSEGRTAVYLQSGFIF
jgi:Omp85 superfamily domain